MAALGRCRRIFLTEVAEHQTWRCGRLQQSGRTDARAPSGRSGAARPTGARQPSALSGAARWRAAFGKPRLLPETFAGARVLLSVFPPSLRAQPGTSRDPRTRETSALSGDRGRVAVREASDWLGGGIPAQAGGARGSPEPLGGGEDGASGPFGLARRDFGNARLRGSGPRLWGSAPTLLRALGHKGFPPAPKLTPRPVASPSVPSRISGSWGGWKGQPYSPS